MDCPFGIASLSFPRWRERFLHLRQNDVIPSPFQLNLYFKANAQECEMMLAGAGAKWKPRAVKVRFMEAAEWLGNIAKVGQILSSFIDDETETDMPLAKG